MAGGDRRIFAVFAAISGDGHRGELPILPIFLMFACWAHEVIEEALGLKAAGNPGLNIQRVVRQWQMLADRNVRPTNAVADVADISICA